MKTHLHRWRAIDGETVFTAVLLGIAIYMFVGSYDFSSRAATFPRAISGAAIVGCTLLLISSYLPEPVRAFIKEETRIVQHSDETDDSEKIVEEPEEEDELKPRNSVYTGLLIGGYILLAYLLGFYFATPVFIIGYVVLLDINRLYALALLLASVGIVYGFEHTLGVPLNEGMLFFVGV